MKRALGLLALWCGAALAQHEGHQVSPGAAPQGYAPVSVEGSALGPFPLSTARVEPRALERVIRTYGIVSYDETRTSHVHPKVRGTLESVSADFVGKQVKRGEPVAELFSPTVLSAQLELLAVLRLGRGRGDALVESARQRLALWDVPKPQIDRLLKTRKASRTFTLLAPRAGTVISRRALNGMYVEPGTELLVVSDLSVVWALIDLYEADVPLVTRGQEVRLEVEGVAAPVPGRIDFLPPIFDEGSRTLKARVVLDNRSGTLRPGAFVRASLAVPLGNRLSVPAQAVIRTGVRALVFVVHGGHVEPREVTLGLEAGDFVEILSGVTAGEEVATQAQFLLDSESRLKATSGPGGHGGHGS